jgi:tRNA 2-selenouridine synthase
LNQKKPHAISLPDLKEIFRAGRAMIDVRAPVEYLQGHLPGAVNLPLLNNDERALIGTTYKEQGHDAAVALGYQIISGELKEARVRAWTSMIEKRPDAVVYCARGGQRSHISQGWMSAAGFEIPLIAGGYKVARNFLLSEIDTGARARELIVVAAPTGSGKTELLQDVKDFYPVIDLEALARHRGSAFGALDEPQPSQANFENQVAVSLIATERSSEQGLPTLVEDESRMIGKCQLPAALMEKMEASSLLRIEEPLESRVEKIFHDYVLATKIGIAHRESQSRECRDLEGQSAGPGGSSSRDQALAVFAKYKASLQAISRRLGGLRSQEILTDLDEAEREFRESNLLDRNRMWIEKLLVYYYDPLYRNGESRDARVVFKGSRRECYEFLRNQSRAKASKT